jgi:hypothetical protein
MTWPASVTPYDGEALVSSADVEYSSDTRQTLDSGTVYVGVTGDELLASKAGAYTRRLSGSTSAHCVG